MRVISEWARTDRRRDERGAYSIFFILLSTVMFGLAALGVDLGNMYQRKAETQSQADLAATSAAPALLKSHADAVVQVSDYLNHNLKLGQADVSSAQLADGSLTNGEVTFPTAYSMKVVTPGAKVRFGLSVPLTHVDSADVSASATVGLGTPGADKLIPFYAVFGEGCDFGAQVLSDPANGHVQSIVPTNLAPPLTNPTQVSNGTLTDTTPYQFPSGAGGTVVITGTKLNGVNRVGFYRMLSESPNQVEVAIPSNASSTTIGGLALPSTVANTPGVWWIRTYQAGSNKGWSPLDQSLPIRIGEGPIMCPGTSSSGNYGSLKLARSTPVSTWAPDNIAVGLQPPLSLSVQTNPVLAPLCTPGTSGVVYTATTGGAVRLPNTNCVDTDTGLAAQVATEGFVTGTNTGYQGRLVKPTTTSVAGRQCAPGHTTHQRSLLGRSLNDDVLSCFLDDPNMTLATIASPTYAGPAVLNQDVYDSPRFCYVPVVSIDPSTGGSKHYSIVDMRPCFITAEANDSTYNSQKFTDGSASTTGNGLDVQSTKVTSIHVFFFNKNALPDEGPAQAGVILDPNGPLVPVLSD